MGVLQTELKGYSAEFLVRADLILNGIITHSPDIPSTPYDLIALVGAEFKKVQIKSRTADSQNRIKVDLRKSNGSNRSYSEADCDIMVIVEPHLRLIAYLPSEVWLGKTQLTIYTRFMPMLNGTKTKDDRLYFSDFTELPA